nr:MAG TPA: hypothetical protein [Caudoviricetes sp.]
MITRISTILPGKAPPFTRTFFPSGSDQIPIPPYPIL